MRVQDLELISLALSLHTLTSGDMNELTVLDVKGFPISWQCFIGHPRGKRLSILARTFIDFMYKEGPSLLPESVIEGTIDTLPWAAVGRSAKATIISRNRLKQT